MDEDTRLHNSKNLFPVNQLTKDHVAWIILSYVILSALGAVNRDLKIAVYGKRLTSRNSFVIKSKS